MRKIYNYVVPIVLFVGIAALFFFTISDYADSWPYYIADRVFPRQQFIVASVSVTLFAIGYIVECVLVRHNRYTAAIVVTVVKYICLMIGVAVGFAALIVGVMFIALLGTILLPILGCFVAIATVGDWWLFIVLVAAVEAGMIVEIVLAVLEKKSAEKKIVPDRHEREPETER